MASRTGDAGLDADDPAVWTGQEGGSASWGSTFRVKWQTIYDLSFNDVMHLRNPYNENKPIKISVSPPRHGAFLAALSAHRRPSRRRALDSPDTAPPVAKLASA